MKTARFPGIAKAKPVTAATRALFDEIDAPVKIHLVLKGYALCDFQWRDGGKHATTSVKQFEAIPDSERCKECARKLAKLQSRI